MYNNNSIDAVLECERQRTGNYGEDDLDYSNQIDPGELEDREYNEYVDERCLCERNQCIQSINIKYK